MIELPRPDLIQDSFDPVGETEIGQIEYELNAQLPPDYKEMLLTHNGGFVRYPVGYPILDHARFGIPDGGIDCFFGISADEPIWDLVAANREYRGGHRVPPELLPIADCYGNVLCISIAGPHTWSVYFWEHEHESAGDPTWDNVHLVATSFADFLRSFSIVEDLLVVNESQPVFRDVERGDIGELRRKLEDAEGSNLRNSENRTLLMCAAWSRRPVAMKLLLDRSAGVHFPDKVGRTALHYAAKGHSLDCVKLLLSHGADPNVQDANGETPLISALKESGGRIPRFLIGAGADVNKRTHLGETALSVCQNARAREALLAAGARPA